MRANKLAKIKERKERDLMLVKCIKDKNEGVLVKEEIKGQRRMYFEGL